MPNTETIVIGIDCATQLQDRGIAIAKKNNNNNWYVIDLFTGQEQEKVVKQLRKSVSNGDNVLLALDAPLGWPSALGSALVKHEAGKFIKDEPDNLFHRVTDTNIYERFGKKSLEVGANLIARTAHSALKLLQDLRQQAKTDIEMAWDPAFTGIRAIEVYPSVTLMAIKSKSEGYKTNTEDHKMARESILGKLMKHIHISDLDQTKAKTDADLLDALICVLAGIDFIEGCSIGPDGNKDIAKKEGWIWVRGVKS